MNIDEMVELFEAGRLTINYNDADAEQMLQFETIMNELTAARPHDSMSFSQHMRKYADKFCYLVCDEETKVVASFAKDIERVRWTQVSIDEFLDAAGCNTSESVEYSEFESIL